MTSFAIIVPFCGEDSYLESCLNHISSQNYQNYSVLLLNDGGPPINKSLLQRFSCIKEVVQAEKLLFSRLINQYWDMTSSDWVILLNSDSFLDKDFLLSLSVHIERNPNDLSLSPCVRNNKGEVVSWGIKRGLSFRPYDVKTRDLSQVWGPPGCALVLRRDVLVYLKKIYGDIFSPEIRFFYSDLDLSCRLKENGFSTALVPKARLVHIGGGSLKQKKGILAYRYCCLSKDWKERLLQDRQAFLKKYFKGKEHWIYYPFIWAYNLLLRIFYWL